MELSRQAAVGTWIRAEQFAWAGEVVHANNTKPAEPMVAYFLYCHAFELVLKAFLIGEGFTDNKLRELGHDLEMTLEAAKCLPAFDGVALTDEDVATIQMLNAYYRGKGFEYLFVGSVRLPVIECVQRASQSLLDQIKPIVDRAARRAA